MAVPITKGQPEGFDPNRVGGLQWACHVSVYYLEIRYLNTLASTATQHLFADYPLVLLTLDAVEKQAETNSYDAQQAVLELKKTVKPNSSYY